MVSTPGMTPPTTCERAPPPAAGSRVSAPIDWNAVIVVEKNQGGVFVSNVIKGVDPSIPIVPVWASKGKDIRAEPIVLAECFH